MKFYSLKPILKLKCIYNMIIGERSNGKTFAVLDYALKKYCDSGGVEQLGLIRRWQDDFKGKRAATMYDAIVAEGKVKEYTKGEWTDIYYYASKWYLCRYEENKRIINEVPIAYAFALTSMEHDKSTSYPNITTILFDEFLTRAMYLPDEFVLFMNTLSTIIRQRDNVIIFMCANTVNKYSPYFSEMGLKNIENMQQGKIDIYRYGDSDLTVAVEYCSNTSREGKPSDKYFAFDNPHLQMITGGSWEIAIYNHLFKKYKPSEVIYKYYISFASTLLEAEIVCTEDMLFTFIHNKTTELKDLEEDLIYSTEPSGKYNHALRINKPFNKLSKSIWNMFLMDKVCYESNEVGEIVNNYLKWCGH